MIKSVSDSYLEISEALRVSILDGNYIIDSSYIRNMVSSTNNIIITNESYYSRDEYLLMCDKEAIEV